MEQRKRSHGTPITYLVNSLGSQIKNYDNNLAITRNKCLWQNFGYIPNLDLSLHQNVKQFKQLRIKDNTPNQSIKASITYAMEQHNLQ